MKEAKCLCKKCIDAETVKNPFFFLMEKTEYKCVVCETQICHSALNHEAMCPGGLEEKK